LLLHPLHHRFEDVKDIYHDEAALVNAPKTGQKFGFQPCLFSGLSLTILTWLLNEVRPFAVTIHPQLDNPGFTSNVV
jgi:hypothetical protein